MIGLQKSVTYKVGMLNKIAFTYTEGAKCVWVYPSHNTFSFTKQEITELVVALSNLQNIMNDETKENSSTLA